MKIENMLKISFLIFASIVVACAILVLMAAWFAILQIAGAYGDGWKMLEHACLTALGLLVIKKIFSKKEE